MSVASERIEQLVEALADDLAAKTLERLEVASPATSPEPWRLLTLQDAAGRLGRSERWVRERVRRGDLPHVRLDGGALCFELDDLQAFARARRVDCREAPAGLRIVADGGRP